MARNPSKKAPDKKVKRMKDLPPRTRSTTSVKGGCQNNLLPGLLPAAQKVRDAAN
jgi:hypothetical protein